MTHPGGRDFRRIEVVTDDPRLALAETLSEELGADITPEFLASVDRVLARLYLFGFIVAKAPDEALTTG